MICSRINNLLLVWSNITDYFLFQFGSRNHLISHQIKQLTKMIRKYMKYKELLIR